MVLGKLAMQRGSTSIRRSLEDCQRRQYRASLYSSVGVGKVTRTSCGSVPSCLELGPAGVRVMDVKFDVVALAAYVQ
jgi:hypothetical protein